MKRALLVTVGAILAVVAVLVWRSHKGEPATADSGSSKPHALPSGAIERAPQPGEPIANLPTLADDDPAGTLRLEGSVLDANNKPVDGATVVLGANPPRTATTEADGSFAFERLVGRPYTLIARAQGGVAGPVTARLTDKSEPVILKLRPAAKLAVRVVGGDARPIDGATVELRGVDLQSATTSAGLATFATVVPGNYEVVAWAPKFAKSYQPVRVVAGEVQIRLMLAAGAAASGRVVDATGAPVAGARVVFISAGELRQPVDARLDGVTTTPDGAFRFVALPAGSLRFLGTHPDHAAGTSALVTLDGATEKTGIEVKLAAGATVSGRVVDTAKQPVSGARVRITAEGGGGRRQRGGGTRQPPRQAFTDAKGEFEVKGLPRAELMATASADLGASTGTEVDASGGDVHNVLITLDLTQTIAGTVVDLEGNPVEGAQVTAFARPDAAGDQGGPPRRGGGGGGNAQLTDGAGRFKLTGLGAGAYLVHASRNTPQPGGGGRRNRGGDGIEAQAGDQNVKITLPPEGGVKGKVAFSDGSPPAIFAAILGPAQQSFVGDAFELPGIAPGDYTLTIRGAAFDTYTQDVTIEPGKTVDVGTLTVTQGRRLLGTVVDQNNQPVPGATVYAGRQVMGSGTSNNSPVAGMNNFAAGMTQDSKQDTTAPDGTFALAGFGDGDLTVIADLPSVGRSKAMLVPETNTASLVLQLQPYGSLSGMIMQGGVPGAGIAVTVQSTTTPGALYVVLGGADGAYRFDNLAPDMYKVSATLRSRGTVRFFSDQVNVPASKEVVVNLTIDQGNITVVATPVATTPVGMGVGWLMTGSITAATARDLTLKMAASGPGASQMVFLRAGEPATFADVTPNTYSACIVPLPIDVKGFGAFSYVNRHGATLPAFCVPIVVGATPAQQSVSIPVTLPAMVQDPTAGGTGPAGPRGGGTAK